MDSILYSVASATDITDQFIDGCKELNELEYATDTHFKLSDAMSAIELMEPKMDSGMKFIEKRVDIFKENAKTLLTELELNDIIAIFDASYSMLASWLNAQPPDHSILTNLCLFVPSNTLKCSPYVHALTCSFSHLFDLFKLYILTASVANEEDISMGVNTTQSKFTDAYIGELLRDSINRLDQTSKTKSNNQEIDALRCRFEFLLELFDLCKTLLPSIESMTTNSSDYPRFIPDFKNSNLCILRCLQLNKKILNTIHVGAQPADGIDAEFSWLPVFDNNAHLYLSQSSFPRTPKIMSRMDTCRYFGQLLEKVLHIITKSHKLFNSIEAIIKLLQEIAEDDNSCILIRSIAQLIVMPNDQCICGVVPLADIVLTSIHRSNKMNGTIEEFLQIDKLMQDGQILDNFLLLTVRTFVGIFQTLGHNLAKQREKFLRTNFEDLGALILEVNNLSKIEPAQLNTKDTNETNNHLPNLQQLFSNYLLHTILDLLYYHFSLGFRMRLFQPYEFHYIYWYFGDCVVRNLCSMAERECNALILDFSKNAIHSQKKISGKKQQQKTKLDNEFRRALAIIKMKSQSCRIEAVMSQAMCKLCLGLIISQRMAIPAQEHLRYAKRVEHFSTLPMSLFYTYDEYLHESRILELQNFSDQECFASAAELFGKVVTLVKNTELKEDDRTSASLTALQQVAKQNMVVAKLMSTKTLEKRLSFEFCSDYQLNFPIIKLL